MIIAVSELIIKNINLIADSIQHSCVIPNKRLKTALECAVAKHLHGRLYTYQINSTYLLIVNDSGIQLGERVTVDNDQKQASQ